MKSLKAEDVEDVVGGDGDALATVDVEGNGIGLDCAFKDGVSLPQRRARRVEKAEGCPGASNSPAKEEIVGFCSKRLSDNGRRS